MVTAMAMVFIHIFPLTFMSAPVGTHADRGSRMEPPPVIFPPNRGDDFYFEFLPSKIEESISLGMEFIDGQTLR